jgi:hypothetical protein
MLSYAAIICVVHQVHNLWCESPARIALKVVNNDSHRCLDLFNSCRMPSQLLREHIDARKHPRLRSFGGDMLMERFQHILDGPCKCVQRPWEGLL